MAMPERVEDFASFASGDARIFIERTVLDEGPVIEFVIPHVGSFTITLPG
ncbi:MAG: hypothetical protein V1774_02505 [Candidatus Eisenbacteria bacterium]